MDKLLQLKYDYKSIRDMFNNIPMNDGKSITDTKCKEIFEEIREDLEDVIRNAVDECEDIIHNHITDNSDEDSE